MAPLEQVRSDLTRALAAWSVVSLAGGAVGLAWSRGRPDRSGSAAGAVPGFARQSLAWGAIDLGIAALGHRGAGRGVQDRAAETAALRRLLLVNAALDVGYVAAGVALVRAGSVRGRDSAGDGLGVAVQGAFLLVLDLASAARLRTTRV